MAQAGSSFHFKRVIASSPGILPRLGELCKTRFKSYSEGGLRIQEIRNDGRSNAGAWKAEYCGGKYFLKNCGTDGIWLKRNGYVQFKLLEAMGAILRMDAEKYSGIAPVKPHFGYNDGGTSFLVTEYVQMKLTRADLLPPWLGAQADAFIRAALEYGIVDLYSNIGVARKNGKEFAVFFDPEYNPDRAKKSPF